MLTALHSSADAALDACDRALRLATTSHHSLGRIEQQGLEARWDVQMELEAGGLTVRGGLRDGAAGCGGGLSQWGSGEGEAGELTMRGGGSEAKG